MLRIGPEDGLHKVGPCKVVLRDGLVGPIPWVEVDVVWPYEFDGEVLVMPLGSLPLAVQATVFAETN